MFKLAGWQSVDGHESHKKLVYSMALRRMSSCRLHQIESMAQRCFDPWLRYMRSRHTSLPAVWDRQEIPPIANVEIFLT